jgi:hypothetical protein
MDLRKAVEERCSARTYADEPLSPDERWLGANSLSLFSTYAATVGKLKR